MRVARGLSALALTVSLGVGCVGGASATATATAIGPGIRSVNPDPGPVTTAAAGLAVADRLLALQHRSGAIADTPGGGIVNEDSNLAYALWGLAAGYRATGQRRFLRGLRRGVSWLADRMVMEPGRWRGSFWYAYRSRPPFSHRRISPGGRVADVRGVDSSSALFVYDLWLYTRLSGDPGLARRLRPRALAAVDFVLSRNRSDDGFFYSSWQRRRGSTRWRLWRYQYAADQADVRLGMAAAARLYGTRRHRRAAGWLTKQVTDAFFLPDRQRFALGREHGRGDSSLEGFNGIFPQGYLPWVFPGSSHSVAALGWLAGCAEPTGALRCRPAGAAYSLSAAVLALTRDSDQAVREGALGWLLGSTFHPRSGAVGDSDRHPDEEYSNVDGFTALALLGPPAGPFRWPTPTGLARKTQGI